ncbi:hypothetical protein ACFL5G_02695 [Candidatus Margulisiibacteriota bacterium]
MILMHIVKMLSSFILPLSLAYIVYVFASKEKKDLKKIGQVLAWSIVVLTVISMLGKVWICSTMCKFGKAPGGHKCMMMKK